MNKSKFAIICGLGFLFTLFSNATLAQNTYDKLCNQGLEYEKTGSLDGAINKYTEAIKTDPRLWTGYSYRAKANYKKQKVDDAIVDISQAINLSPETISLYEIRSRCYEAKGIYDKAIADYNLIISQLGEKNERIYLLRYQRGLDLYKSNRYEEAVSDFNQVINLSSTIPQVVEYSCGMRASCYFKLNRFADAIKDYDSYLVAEPDDIRAIFNQGFSFLKVGDTIKAKASALRLIKLEPGKEICFSDEHLLSIYDMEMRRKVVKQSLEDAHANMEEEKSSPSKSLANIRLTEAFKKLNNGWLYSSGIEKEDQESESTILKDIFFVYSKLKDKPDVPEIARKYMVQAASATGEKKYRDAIVLWNKVLNISPYYPVGYFNCALLREQSGDYRTSIVDMKKYLELCPDAPDARGAKDKIYEWEGKVKDQEIVVDDNIIFRVKGSKFGRFTDSRDGKTYKTINIGFQTIMAENLSYRTGSGCWAYENNESDAAQYGYLYNWQTATNVCPAGWHLPDKEEFETLLQTVGNVDKNTYNDLLTGGNSGFSALFGGIRDTYGKFTGFGKLGGFWSNTPQILGKAWYMFVTDKKYGVQGNVDKPWGYSIRCFQDN